MYSTMLERSYNMAVVQLIWHAHANANGIVHVPCVHVHACGGACMCM